MACIYHIYSLEDTKTRYIGQTMADPEPDDIEDLTKDGDKSKPYNRPLDHFSGLYKGLAKTRENIMFYDFMMKHPLNTMVVEIYNDSNFGVDAKTMKAFFNEWKEEGKFVPYEFTETDEGIKYTVQQQNFATSVKLDAAEIIHNYVFYKQGCKLLTHQIGGQRTGFTNTNGVVLNSTLSVEDGCNVIDAASSKTMQKAQALFDKHLNKQLENFTLNNDTLLRALSKAALKYSLKDSKTDKNTSDMSNGLKKEWTRIIATYLKHVLPTIRDVLDKAIYGDGNINVRLRMDNLYSTIDEKWLANFDRSRKGSFNIVNLIIDKLMANRYKIAKAKKLSNALDEIEKILNEGITLQNRGGISFTNFFSLKENNNLSPQNWKVTGTAQVNYAIGDNPYAKSFKLKAYWFFLDAVKKCWQKDPQITPVQLLQDGDKDIIIISTYRLSSALKKYFDQVGHPYITRNWDAYCHQMLTLYTKNNGVTIGGKFNYFGNQYITVGGSETKIGSLKPVDEMYFDGNSWSKMREDKIDHAEGLIGYRFSEPTIDDIEFWIDKGIKDIKYY